MKVDGEVVGDIYGPVTPILSLSTPVGCMRLSSGSAGFRPMLMADMALQCTSNYYGKTRTAISTSLKINAPHCGIVSA